MRGKVVKKIDWYLEGLQEASGVTDSQFKNIRRNVKRHVSRFNGTPSEALTSININEMIKRSNWV